MIHHIRLISSIYVYVAIIFLDQTASLYFETLFLYYTYIAIFSIEISVLNITVLIM